MSGSRIVSYELPVLRRQLGDSFADDLVREPPLEIDRDRLPGGILEPADRALRQLEGIVEHR